MNKHYRLHVNIQILGVQYSKTGLQITAGITLLS